MRDIYFLFIQEKALDFLDRNKVHVAYNKLLYIFIYTDFISPLSKSRIFLLHKICRYNYYIIIEVGIILSTTIVL